MAWRDMTPKERITAIAFVFLVVLLQLLPSPTADIWASDIADRKAKVINKSSAALTEVCLQGGLPAPKRQECRRLENLLEEARMHQNKGLHPLPRWMNVEHPDLQFIAIAYDVQYYEISNVISSRYVTISYNRMYLKFSALVLFCLIMTIGNFIRERSYA